MESILANCAVYVDVSRYPDLPIHSQIPCLCKLGVGSVEQIIRSGFKSLVIAVGIHVTVVEGLGFPGSLPLKINCSLQISVSLSI